MPTTWRCPTAPSGAADVAALLRTGGTPLIHSAATMRSEEFRAVSGYRGAFEVALDYDLRLRIASRARITNLREPVVLYRIHSDQVSSRDFSKTATEVQAALASGRARASGEPDPVDTAESLDPATLNLIRVEPQDVAGQEIDYALWLART